MVKFAMDYEKTLKKTPAQRKDDQGDPHSQNEIGLDANNSLDLFAYVLLIAVEVVRVLSEVRYAHQSPCMYGMLTLQVMLVSCCAPSSVNVENGGAPLASTVPIGLSTSGNRIKVRTVRVYACHRDRCTHC